MRIRSIQLKIALLAGVCVVAASGALVGYSIISAANSKAFVSENVDTLTEDSTKNHLKTLALAQAALIESPLDIALLRHATWPGRSRFRPHLLKI